MHIIEKDGKFYKRHKVSLIKMNWFNMSPDFMIYKETHNWNDALMLNSKLEVSTNETYIRNTILINQRIAATNVKNKGNFYALIVTSVEDKNIKEGEWYTRYGDGLFNTLEHICVPGSKKIEAMTASQTGNHNLPKPSLHFVKEYETAYNLGHQITEVLVEYKDNGKAKSFVDDIDGTIDRVIQWELNITDGCINIVLDEEKEFARYEVKDIAYKAMSFAIDQIEKASKLEKLTIGDPNFCDQFKKRFNQSEKSVEEFFNKHLK